MTKGAQGRTFLPMPLVGDGAGETGTKSILFGDDDTDFSKSLSLCRMMSEEVRTSSKMTTGHMPGQTNIVPLPTTKPLQRCMQEFSTDFPFTTPSGVLRK